MFRSLRLRLTLLYLLVASILVALIGGSTYGLLRYYFQTTTDLALQHKMAHELRRLGAPVPPELAAADTIWYANRNNLLPTVPTRRQGEGAEERDDDHEERDDVETEEAYDGELSAIFVLPLRADGRLLFDPNPMAPPIRPDPTAAAVAFAAGSDWRTARRTDGTGVRLFTYRAGRSDGPTLLQLGRTLADQGRILDQLLIGLLGLGGASSLLLGAGSWWLAGRSLVPAQQAWERQQTFVANASHELRTPLTLMRASAKVALRQVSPADADRRALLDDVLQECDHMARLVDDLLLLSRLDAGRLPLARQVVVLADLLADVQRQMGRLADERGVRLTTSAANGAAIADPARLRQVLLILLDNALRHTPPGGSVQLEAAPNGRRVELAVADTGSGIPPEHLPHVFDRFYRVDSARGGESGGAGLGLAIARALIEAQQGEIRLESRPRQGTRVAIRLPGAGA